MLLKQENVKLHRRHKQSIAIHRVSPAQLNILQNQQKLKISPVVQPPLMLSPLKSKPSIILPSISKKKLNDSAMKVRRSSPERDNDDHDTQDQTKSVSTQLKSQRYPINLSIPSQGQLLQAADTHTGDMMQIAVMETTQPRKFRQKKLKRQDKIYATVGALQKDDEPMNTKHENSPTTFKKHSPVVKKTIAVSPPDESQLNLDLNMFGVPFGSSFQGRLSTSHRESRMDATQRIKDAVTQAIDEFLDPISQMPSTFCDSHKKQKQRQSSLQQIPSRNSTLFNVKVGQVQIEHNPREEIYRTPDPQTIMIDNSEPLVLPVLRPLDLSPRFQNMVGRHVREGQIKRN